MGYALNKQDDNVIYGVMEFYADSVDDIANIPTNYTPGSTCLVKEGPALYVLTTEHSWEPLE